MFSFGIAEHYILSSTYDPLNLIILLLFISIQYNTRYCRQLYF